MLYFSFTREMDLFFGFYCGNNINNNNNNNNNNDDDDDNLTSVFHLPDVLKLR